MLVNKSTGLVSAVALAAALGSSCAIGQDMGAPYIEFGAGFNAMGVALGNVVSTDPDPLTFSTTTPLGLGGTAYAAFGASPLPGMRLAIEANATGNSGARFNIQAEGVGSLLVDVATFSVLAQAWKDFEVSEFISFHIGGGLGLGVITTSSTGDNGLTTTTSAPGLAYMVGVGGGYTLENGMVLTLDYRMSGIGTGAVGTVPIFTDDASETVSGDLSTSLKHAVTVGVRIPIGGLS